MSTITIPANLDSLAPVADFVRQAATAAGLDPKASYRLRLAVDEIVTNVVLHGHANAPEAGNIQLWAEWSAAAVTVTIEDTGAAFDPQQAGPPDVAQPAEERRLGGLGIFLALGSVDRYSYERQGGRNRSILVIERARAVGD